MITGAQVASVVNRIGGTIEWEKKTAGTYSPATGGITGQSTTLHSIKGHYRNYKAKEISGLLEIGDKELRISSNLSFTPMEGDRVKIDGTFYKVMGVDNRLNKLLVVHLRGIR